MAKSQITAETIYYASATSKQNTLAFLHTITVTGSPVLPEGAEVRRMMEINTLEINGFMSAKAFMDRAVEKSRAKLLRIADGEKDD